MSGGTRNTASSVGSSYRPHLRRRSKSLPQSIRLKHWAKLKAHCVWQTTGQLRGKDLGQYEVAETGRWTQAVTGIMPVLFQLNVTRRLIIPPSSVQVVWRSISQPVLVSSPYWGWLPESLKGCLLCPGDARVCPCQASGDATVSPCQALGDASVCPCRAVSTCHLSLSSNWHLWVPIKCYIQICDA